MMSNMFKCLYCREPLLKHSEKGYVHQDGKWFKTKVVIKNGKEVEVDDHLAFPDYGTSITEKKHETKNSDGDAGVLGKST